MLRTTFGHSVKVAGEQLAAHLRRNPREGSEYQDRLCLVDVEAVGCLTRPLGDVPEEWIALVNPEHPNAGTVSAIAARAVDYNRYSEVDSAARSGPKKAPRIQLATSPDWV